MPLPVMMEPPIYDETSEPCVFCGNETRCWHMASNTPVCKSCAETHTERDLAKAMDD